MTRISGVPLLLLMFMIWITLCLFSICLTLTTTMLYTGWESRLRIFKSSSDTSSRPPILHLQLCCATVRFGNRLFMYASAYGLAKSSRKQMTFDAEFNVLKKMFPAIDELIAKRPKDARFFSENGYYATARRSLFTMEDYDNVTLSGYLQSFRYFERSKADIMRTLTTVKPPIANEPKKFVQAIRTKVAKARGTSTSDIVLVGLHYRGGDRQNKRGHIINKQYFQKAMSHFKSRYKNVHFIGTSDSKLHFQNVLISESSEFTMSTFTDYQQDFVLLTSCDHVVMTTGSFGWWAAYLAGGEVIYFNQTSDPKFTPIPGFSHDDFYPKHWLAFS